MNIIELDEGLDGETFFLYVFLGALGVLMLVVGQQFLYSVGKKRGTSTSSSTKKHIEMGTSNQNGVDLKWIPKQIYNEYVLGKFVFSKY